MRRQGQSGRGLRGDGTHLTPVRGDVPDPIDLYDRFEPLVPGVLVVVMVMLVMAEADDRRISVAIDARRGSIDRLERIDVPMLVPRDGETVRAWGMLERISRRRFVLHSAQGELDGVGARRDAGRQGRGERCLEGAAEPVAAKALGSGAVAFLRGCWGSWP